MGYRHHYREYRQPVEELRHRRRAGARSREEPRPKEVQHADQRCRADYEEHDREKGVGAEAGYEAGNDHKNVQAEEGGDQPDVATETGQRQQGKI